MALVLLVGEDEALLEGLAQTIGSAGHRVRQAFSMADARRVADEETPLVAVVERRLVSGSHAGALRTAPGGATVLFRTATADDAVLPAGLHRGVLAEVTLPLERKRLTALVASVVDRAQRVGRGARVDTPPETHRRM